MCSETQDTRVCKSCSEELPLTKEYFYSRKDTNGFRRECKKCTQEKTLLRKYSVCFKKYHEMIKRQQFRCGICRGKLESSRYTKFAVDHCHKSGRIRGLLCHQCNTALGLFKDSPIRLINAIRYLQNPPCEDIV